MKKSSHVNKILLAIGIAGWVGAYLAGSTNEGAFAAVEPAPTHSAPLRTEEVRFSPDGGCAGSVASFIREAKSSVRMQAYGFTSDPVAAALCDAAAKPGVTVEVLLDRSELHDKRSQMSRVQACGVHVSIDSAHQIAHNKVVVVDGESVETGSFNFTAAAEKGNAENCLIIRHDPPLAAAYGANWTEHRSHSTPR